MDQKVKPGDDIIIKADTWNSFIFAADEARQRRSGRTVVGQASGQDTSIVQVQNTSASAMNQWNAVGITGVVCTPTSSDLTAPETIEFANNLVLTVGTPAATDSKKWLVLLQPLQINEVGVAVAMGVTQAWINIQATTDTKADITSGSTIPNGGKDGHEILWIAGGVGTASATGNQFAVIRIGGQVSSTFQARITAVTGSFPAWSYTVQRVVNYDSSQSASGGVRWVTDGINITSVLNRCEFAGTATYTYGSGVSITNASTGAINSGSCVIKSLGVGAVVDVTAIPDVAGGFKYSFFADNSGQ